MAPSQSCLAKSAHASPMPACKSSEVTADAIIDGINKLSPELRNKVLSRAWTDVSAVVNECKQAMGAMSSSASLETSSQQDWSKLNQAVKKLNPEEQKARAINAFYEAVISVLQERKDRRF
jgi:hypothetical protein